MEYIRIGTRKKTYFNKKFNRPNNRPTDCQANEKAVCEGRRGIKHDGRAGAVGEAKKKKQKRINVTTSGGSESGKRKEWSRAKVGTSELRNW